MSSQTTITRQVTASRGTSQAQPNQVIARLFIQPVDVQAQVLGHLDTETLAQLALAQGWPQQLPFGEALSRACRDRFLERCGPVGRQVRRLAQDQAPQASVPNWLRVFGQQHRLSQEVHRAWREPVTLAEERHPRQAWRGSVEFEEHTQWRSWPHMALHMAEISINQALVTPHDAYEHYGVERDLLSPATRAQLAAARKAHGQRALQLLGFSGPVHQQSLAGRLVAASSVACLGESAFSAELFAATWAETMPEAGPYLYGNKDKASKQLEAMKLAALALGDVELYTRTVKLAGIGRLPLYDDAYISDFELRLALFAGQNQLVRAIMTTRGHTFSHLELLSTHEMAKKAVDAHAADGALSPEYLAPVLDAIAAVAEQMELEESDAN